MALSLRRFIVFTFKFLSGLELEESLKIIPAQAFEVFREEAKRIKESWEKFKAEEKLSIQDLPISVQLLHDSQTQKKAKLAAKAAERQEAPKEAQKSPLNLKQCQKIIEKFTQDASALVNALAEAMGGVFHTPLLNFSTEDNTYTYTEAGTQQKDENSAKAPKVCVVDLCMQQLTKQVLIFDQHVAYIKACYKELDILDKEIIYLQNQLKKRRIHNHINKEKLSENLNNLWKNLKEHQKILQSKLAQLQANIGISSETIPRELPPVEECAKQLEEYSKISQNIPGKDSKEALQKRCKDLTELLENILKLAAQQIVLEKQKEAKTSKEEQKKPNKKEKRITTQEDDSKISYTNVSANQATPAKAPTTIVNDTPESKNEIEISAEILPAVTVATTSTSSNITPFPTKVATKDLSSPAKQPQLVGFFNKLPAEKTKQKDLENQSGELPTKEQKQEKKAANSPKGSPSSTKTMQEDLSCFEITPSNVDSFVAELFTIRRNSCIRDFCAGHENLSCNVFPFLAKEDIKFLRGPTVLALTAPLGYLYTYQMLSLFKKGLVKLEPYLKKILATAYVHTNQYKFANNLLLNKGLPSKEDIENWKSFGRDMLGTVGTVDIEQNVVAIDPKRKEKLDNIVNQPTRPVSSLTKDDFNLSWIIARYAFSQAQYSRVFGEFLVLNQPDAPIELTLSAHYMHAIVLWHFGEPQKAKDHCLEILKKSELPKDLEMPEEMRLTLIALKCAIQLLEHDITRGRKDHLKQHIFAINKEFARQLSQAFPDTLQPAGVAAVDTTATASITDTPSHTAVPANAPISSTLETKRSAETTTTTLLASTTTSSTSSDSTTPPAKTQPMPKRSQLAGYFVNKPVTKTETSATTPAGTSRSSSINSPS